MYITLKRKKGREILYFYKQFQLNILYVPYSGTGDAANVTGNAENEEHSQIIIHCTPSTGNAQPVLS
jgi:hypothetical protein